MPILQSHDCSKCGAPLLIEADGQTYLCPYCGKSYTYDYFNSDNLLKFAYDALSRGDFGSAGDGFEFMYKKAPHDFSVLRGLYLSSSGVSRLTQLTIREKRAPKEEDLLSTCLENVEMKGKDYFEHLREAAKLASEYQEKQKEIIRLNAEHEAKFRECMLSESKIVDRERWFSNLIDNWSRNEHEILMSICLTFFILIFALLAFAGAIYLDLLTLVFDAAGIITLIFLIYHLLKVRAVRKLRKKHEPLVQESIDIQTELYEKSKHSYALEREYWDEIEAALSCDPEPMVEETVSDKEE